MAIPDAEILAVRFFAVCLKKWIGSAVLGTWWYNYQTPTPTLSATMHSVTDRQTTVWCQYQSTVDNVREYTIRPSCQICHPWRPVFKREILVYLYQIYIYTRDSHGQATDDTSVTDNVCHTRDSCRDAISTSQGLPIRVSSAEGH